MLLRLMATHDLLVSTHHGAFFPYRTGINGTGIPVIARRAMDTSGCRITGVHRTGVAVITIDWRGKIAATPWEALIDRASIPVVARDRLRSGASHLWITGFGGTEVIVGAHDGWGMLAAQARIAAI